ELRGQKTNNINNIGSVYRNGNDTNSTIGTAEVKLSKVIKPWYLVPRYGIRLRINSHLSNSDVQEIFEENYDEPIQLSIISIICQDILKEVNLLGAKKGRNR
ncbi:MAG TPA: hypothetical protein VFJ51_08365, partial [Nitrososphaeraceae archaeon]|nr:hypothetical protein [Nitrososphaeraceae archaeon]